MAGMNRHIQVNKVASRRQVAEALTVVEEVYLREKQWIRSTVDQIPEDIGENRRLSWFLAKVDGRPAGLLRLFYDPQLELPPEFQVTLEAGVNLQALASQGRFVEIGRFMILGEFRRDIGVALRLMRAALKEVVDRDYTHFITDVYEGEPNSPYQFHTRILGFEVIGRHLHGELNCSHTRIILVLNILKGFKRLQSRKSSIYLSLTRGFRRLLMQKAALLADG